MDRRLDRVVAAVPRGRSRCRRGEPAGDGTVPQRRGLGGDRLGRALRGVRRDGAARRRREPPRSNAHVTVLAGLLAAEGGRRHASCCAGRRARGGLPAGPAEARRDLPGRGQARAPKARSTSSSAIESAAGTEEIAGRARARRAARRRPGGLVGRRRRRRRPKAAVSFLKEQQWRTEFATAWVARGRARTRACAGPAQRDAGRRRRGRADRERRTRPWRPAPWPHSGSTSPRERTVFRLVPRVTRPEPAGAAGGRHVARGRGGRRAQARGAARASCCGSRPRASAEVERARATLAGPRGAARARAARRRRGDEPRRAAGRAAERSGPRSLGRPRRRGHGLPGPDRRAPARRSGGS